MTLKELSSFLIKVKFKLLACALVGVLLGVLIYFITPKSYVAYGTLFVTHNVEAKPDFTYEGFYGQQTSISYSKTILNIINSDDLRLKLAQKYSENINFATLWKFSRIVKAKSTGPQLVLVTVKSNSSKDAVDLWTNAVNETLKINHRLGFFKNNSLVVIPVLDAPVVTQSYTSLILNIVVGSLSFLFFGFLGLAYYYKAFFNKGKN